MSIKNMEDFIKKNGGTIVHIIADDIVLCDFCGEDYSNSDKEGGILFGSKATCPNCVIKMMPKIIEYNEEHYIRAECPEGVSFKDWVLSLR